MSPHLTTISRSYCKDEYLKDTDHLLEQIKALNDDTCKVPLKHRLKPQLFTLDVAALYPSIRPGEAMKAVQDAFRRDTTTDDGTKQALISFTNIIFDYTYVKCKDTCYKPLVGIPTGGCNSRQTADFMLHRLIELVKDDIPLWKYVKLLKRFIDDIFGLWLGTTRQFHQFVDKLNAATAPFGIRFGDFEVGSSVNFLDVTLWIDAEGLIQYKLYTKPTDSRLYLKTDSFHPGHVFDAVAYSQMVRVWKRNSTEESARSDIEKLKTDLIKCQHQPQKLEELQKKMHGNLNSGNQSSRPNNGPVESDPTTETITAVTSYFKEIPELKKLLKDLEPDISRLSGKKTRVLVASRKGRTISSTVCKNGSLCHNSTVNQTTQKCGAKKCKMCQLLCNTGEVFNINGIDVEVPDRYNCKTRNAIYISQCQLCTSEVDNTYGGQTNQPVHKRFNGHRSCFDLSDSKIIEKSALAEHSYLVHGENFDLNNFKCMIYNSVNPMDLNRHEARLIGRLRTNVMGINRMNVQK
jgi:hypothetical protein